MDVVVWQTGSARLPFRTSEKVMAKGKAQD